MGPRAVHRTNLDSTLPQNGGWFILLQAQGLTQAKNEPKNQDLSKLISSRHRERQISTPFIPPKAAKICYFTKKTDLLLSLFRVVSTSTYQGRLNSKLLYLKYNNYSMPKLG